MKLLTIVVPSYNTEAYIEKNIKTFLDERLYEKAEVLIINDGSSDGTAKLAERFEENYPGYIRLISKENGGHGSVINLGIKEANGRYFKVVDGDDWVNTENLVKLVADLEKMEADVVLNPYIEVNQQTGKEKKREFVIAGSHQELDSIEIILQNQILMPLHETTYKTNILRDNNVEVTESCFYEDFQYNLYPVQYLQTVKILDYPVYNYLIGQKSQSVSAANSLKNIDMMFTVLCDSLDHYHSVETQLSSLHNEYFFHELLVFARQAYNIFLKNWEVTDILQRMKGFDSRLKEKDAVFYQELGEKYPYIKVMHMENKLLFALCANLFKVYKKLHA